MEENQIVNTNAEAQESATATEATTATTTAPAANGKHQFAPPTAHDDFDWSIDKRNVTAYNKEEKEKYDKVYENTFVQITDGELIKGLVVGVTKTDVVCKHRFQK